MTRKRWAIAMGLMFTTAACIAGMVSSVPVSVTVNADMSGAASGNMVTARTSANAIEYIGCSIQRHGGGATVTAYGFCQARSAGNVSGFCSTDNAQLLDALQGIADYSYLSFSWRADGTCSRISVSTQSFYIP